VTRQSNAELRVGLVALACAAAYYAAARAIPASLLDDVVGSGGLPKSYGIALAVLAVALIARALVSNRRHDDRSGEGAGHSHRKTLGMLLLGLGYGTLLPLLGYAGSIALLIAATAAYQGAGFNRRVAIVAVCGAGTLWALFVWLLGIPQPAGIWATL
jgi:hypothetical protein